MRNEDICHVLDMAADHIQTYGHLTDGHAGTVAAPCCAHKALCVVLACGPWDYSQDPFWILMKHLRFHNTADILRWNDSSDAETVIYALREAAVRLRRSEIWL